MTETLQAAPHQVQGLSLHSRDPSFLLSGEKYRGWHALSPGGWIFGIWARVVQVFKVINLKNPEWLEAGDNLVGGVFLRGSL